MRMPGGRSLGYWQIALECSDLSCDVGQLKVKSVRVEVSQIWSTLAVTEESGIYCHTNGPILCHQSLSSVVHSVYITRLCWRFYAAKESGRLCPVEHFGVSPTRRGRRARVPTLLHAVSGTKCASCRLTPPV